MCLIVTKPIGVQMPNNKDLTRYFDSHPDGFGLAFQDKGRVHILKGAMDTKEMKNLVSRMKKILGKVNPTDIDIIFHFRQATGGYIMPENCHPFPITRNLDALSSLNVVADSALVHNGIIEQHTNYYSKDTTYYYKEQEKTDTQEFIEEVLADMGKALWNPAVQKLISNYTYSKFAILTAKGITYLGDFIADNGYYYSNSSYKVSPKPYLDPDVPPYLSYRTYNPKTKTWDNHYCNKTNSRADITSNSIIDDDDFDSADLFNLKECHNCFDISDTLYSLPWDKDSYVCETCFSLVTGQEINPMYKLV
uniref:Putative glutamine amidotransferase n=1 Tax=viral metagenome TaxID=1070528 RepID=A0A6M3LLE3_9ZZZZ